MVSYSASFALQSLFEVYFFLKVLFILCMEVTGTAEEACRGAGRHTTQMAAAEPTRAQPCQFTTRTDLGHLFRTASQPLLVSGWSGGER